MSRRRSGLLAAAVLGLLALAGVASPVTAGAHPLGNATVNHYDGLHLYSNRIVDSAVEDIAEIPTLQRKSLIDSNHDGTLQDTERASYASRECAAMAASTSISVNGQRMALTVEESGYLERPGVIQLTVGRLTCQLSGSANLSGPATVAVNSSWDSAGIGWHEITAVGTGVTLQQSPFPANSVSDELQHYPNDMLSSPLNVRSGSVATAAGAGTSTYAAAKNLPVAGWAVRALNRIATAFNDLVGSKHLTFGIGLLAILLAMVLGAGHAFLPGHGKTIMAAYLVGRRGRLRDVVLVGATVTITHTAGVLILGLIISITAAFSTTAAEQDLGILSGLIIAGVGLGLLISALVRIRKQQQASVVAGLAELALVPAGAPHEHSHSAHEHSHPAHSHEHEPHSHETHSHEAHSHEAHSHEAHSHEAHSHQPHEHSHDHQPHGHSHEGHEPHGHSHGFGSRSHSHGPGFSRGGLVGLGVAGGLVPSPSALLVLLAAIALGRTAFGIILVLSYGLGMAGALTAAGLLLVKLRNRFANLTAGRRLAAANRLIFLMPILTAGLVLVVGVGLTLRAAHGIV
ncbi:MAG: High-affinity nickel-transporter [Actinomycetota bacterium]|nr:High-affinity nickel-transporter [Actinomycetota bacterium]MDQ2957343.1 High-affinity nickel-transporter [Actinomycetota bacterium]